jgi:predicted metalloendopeptidase
LEILNSFYFFRYGVNILFDIASEAHPENSQRTILWIYEAVFGLPSKEYYFDADKVAFLFFRLTKQ